MRVNITTRPKVCQIGPFPVGTIVEYQVEVTDVDGNTVLAPQYVMGFESLEPFVKTADILFVPDYGGNSTDWFRPYYTNALDELGYGYDVWDTGLRGAPDSSILNLYTTGVVIWAAPDWGYFNDWDVRPDIEAYLDAGGRLFMSGQDIAQDLNGTTLLSDYLHATWIQDRTYLYALSGAIGDPIGDGLTLGIAGGDGADNQYDTDEIDPIAPAVPVLTYDTTAGAALIAPVRSKATEPEWESRESGAAPVPAPSDELKKPRQEPAEANETASPAGVISSGTAGLRMDTGTYKVVFFAFGFEGVNKDHDRQLLMARILRWFGLKQHCDGYDPDESGDTTIVDVQRLAQRWRDSTEYQARYDLNLDRVINVLDVMRMIVRWGTACPSPNYALLFDGIDDFVSVVDTGDFDFDNAFSVEAWVKPLSLTDSGTFKTIVQGTFSEPPFTGGGWAMSLRYSDYSDWGLSVCTPGCEAALSGPGNLQIGQWQHLAGTYDGTTIRTYRDGVAIASAPHSGNVTDINFVLMGIWETSFDGLIDEVRIWNIARGQSEIQADMNRTLNGDEPGLVGYWRFDEGGGQEVFDSTANHNDGRLGSLPTNDSNDPIWLKRLDGP